MRFFLRAYDQNVKYKKSADNANADSFSRLPVSHKKNIDVVDIFYLKNSEVLPVNATRILEEIKKDKKLSDVIKL